MGCGSIRTERLTIIEMIVILNNNFLKKVIPIYVSLCANSLRSLHFWCSWLLCEICFVSKMILYRCASCSAMVSLSPHLLFSGSYLLPVFVLSSSLLQNLFQYRGVVVVFSRTNCLLQVSILSIDERIDVRFTVTLIVIGVLALIQLSFTSCSSSSNLCFYSDSCISFSFCCHLYLYLYLFCPRAAMASLHAMIWDRQYLIIIMVIMIIGLILGIFRSVDGLYFINVSSLKKIQHSFFI